MSDNFDPTHKFFVGQDVVCVNARLHSHQHTPIGLGLVEGLTYRIRWLGIFQHYLDGEYLGIKVNGIVRGADEFGYEDLPYYAKRFRPLVPDKLAAFRNMLTVSPNNDPYAPPAEEGPRRNKKLPVRAPVKEEVE